MAGNSSVEAAGDISQTLVCKIPFFGSGGVLAVAVPVGHQNALAEQNQELRDAPGFDELSGQMLPFALAMLAYLRSYSTSRHNLALEVAALRQQLAVYKRRRTPASRVVFT